MKEFSKSVRFLNGYRLVYKPDHPKAMKSANWLGYVYEHIFIMEKDLGRSIRDDEIVHHLDGDRANNRIENLLVVSADQHSKIHAWMNSGAPICESYRMNRVNSVNPSFKQPKLCGICGHTLQNKQKQFCSEGCYRNKQRKVEWPSKERLQRLLSENSVVSVGKLFGVSDNAVRKWARKYGLNTATLSRAAGTPAEGAETSGEVKSS
jgi:ribosomal protein L37E